MSIISPRRWEGKCTHRRPQHRSLQMLSPTRLPNFRIRTTDGILSSRLHVDDDWLGAAAGVELLLTAAFVCLLFLGLLFFFPIFDEWRHSRSSDVMIIMCECNWVLMPMPIWCRLLLCELKWRCVIFAFIFYFVIRICIKLGRKNHVTPPARLKTKREVSK